MAHIHARESFERKGKMSVHKKQTAYQKREPMGFESKCEPHAIIDLPGFTGIRIMMMPVIIGDMSSMPSTLKDYENAIAQMFEVDKSRVGMKNAGKVGYLTIDEKKVKAATSHRREGKHVDGIYQGESGAWGGGSGGSWGSRGTGMITVSNIVGCRAWNQSFSGWPEYEGECDHLAEQIRDDAEVIFEPMRAYWLDGLCVHESIPQHVDTYRQFVRLSLPSLGPWFEGYTENPLGVLPTGPILPRRKFMDEVMA
jgi:hypothetical protein